MIIKMDSQFKFHSTRLRISIKHSKIKFHLVKAEVKFFTLKFEMFSVKSLQCIDNAIIKIMQKSFLLFKTSWVRINEICMY